MKKVPRRHKEKTRTFGRQWILLPTYERRRVIISAIWKSQKARSLLGKGLKYCGGNEYIYQTLALLESKGNRFEEARKFDFIEAAEVRVKDSEKCQLPCLARGRGRAVTSAPHHRRDPTRRPATSSASDRSPRWVLRGRESRLSSGHPHRLAIDDPGSSTRYGGGAWDGRRRGDEFGVLVEMAGARLRIDRCLACGCGSVADQKKERQNLRAMNLWVPYWRNVGPFWLLAYRGIVFLVDGLAAGYVGPH
ncbi:hypothetical protein HPP92_001727 [Vanilla planifolia]|uniref:Uncharacterized protein n=1 Tax=Vanilla planifolia TaxID=51239 RepID=A0A835VLN8_VANPL|nr:hypothetical protein HPP92_001727 [Vanilla planifolia]